MKKNYRQLNEMDQIIGGMYKVNPSLKDTKFGYAYKRFCEKYYVPLLKERNEKLVLIRVDNALEDPTTKEILRDDTHERGFKFDREGLKKCIKSEIKMAEEFDLKEVEIEPIFSSFVPEGLTEEQKEIFAGCILKIK